MRANWYANNDLRNGQTGTIITIDHKTGRVGFRRDHDGIEVALPRRYLDQSVDFGYAQTIHTAQGHTYDQVHIYADETMTAEHGYTGLSRARGETHVWTTERPGPLGDCGHIHCPPAVEDRIDTLTHQPSRTGTRPPATIAEVTLQMMSDRELVDRSDELERVFRDSPLGGPVPDVEAFDRAVTEAQAVVDHLGTQGPEFNSR